MQQHCDPEDLALIALGEVTSPHDMEHLQACPQCQAEMESLRHVVAVGRDRVALTEPPARVWQGIQAELSPNVSTMEQARKKRGIPGWTLAVAAAVGAILGGSVVAGVGSSDSPSEQIVASAQLTPLPDGPDPGTTATAALNRTDGTYTVTVEASDLPGPEGFYEVWLLDEENAGLIALGSLSPGETSATFPVPEGISLDRFRAVDISDEPLDGDPTHSTVTVLRGTLDI